MENKFLTVGYITSTRGLKGVLRVKSTSYFAKERYKKGNLVYLFNEKDNTRISVIANTYSTDNKFDYVSFKDLEDDFEFKIKTPYQCAMEKLDRKFEEQLKILENQN